jgi:hypothetical protein
MLLVGFAFCADSLATWVPRALHAAFVEGLTGWIISLMSLVVVMIFLRIVRLLREGGKLSCEVLPDAFVVKHGNCCEHRVGLQVLNLEQASITDLSFDPGNQPRKRTNGGGCPGRQTGWFMLRNGSRALVFTPDPQRVARIPTHEGYTLLVSAPDPSRLIDDLRAAAGRLQVA